MDYILSEVIQENIIFEFEITRFYLGVITLKMAVLCTSFIILKLATVASFQIDLTIWTSMRASAFIIVL